MCVDDEVAWQWGNGGIRSLTMVVRRSAVVGGGLHNRRENANEEEGGQFTKRSSGGWSSLRSAMAAAPFTKSDMEGVTFRRLTVGNSVAWGREGKS
jgi:hypothetical protein